MTVAAKGAWAPGELPAPLPRVLIPLPEESLAGFVLRNAFRLGQTPLRFAQITGLTAKTGHLIPLAAVYGLDPEANFRFARATHLSVADSHALAGQALLRRYLGPEYADRLAGRRVHGTIAEPWFFHKPSRYCPQCLSGDGSPIQDKFGGAWKLGWRMPVTFACTQHRSILSHRCPSCGATAPGYGSGLSWPHMPRPGTGGIHPAHCRVCTADLSAGGTANPMSPTEQDRALTLQATFDQVLNPAGVDAAPLAMGQRVTPPTYFLDLHVITTYLQVSWGSARPPDDECASGYDDWHQSSTTSPELPPPPKAAGSPTPINRPPLDTAACARLLLMAADILHSPTSQEATDRLAALHYNETDLEPWLDALSRRQRTSPSPGLLQAISGLPRRFGAPTAQTRPQHHVGSRHIPQLLPATWWPEAHERPRRGPALDRRITAALRLAQLLDGCDLADSATALGIPSTRVARATKTVRSLDAKSWTEFDAAVHRIHDQLTASNQQLIDFCRRRQAMWSWRLSEDQWAALLNVHPLRWMQPHLKYRFYAEVRIWCQVTQGVHFYSPIFLTERPGFAAPLYTSMNAPAIQARNQSILDILHPRLGQLADAIATAIDSGLMV